MKKLLEDIRAFLTAAGVLTVAGFVAWEMLLTDTAKAESKNAVLSVISDIKKLYELIDPKNESQASVSEPYPNVQSTQKQWEDLGY